MCITQGNAMKREKTERVEDSAVFVWLHEAVGEREREGW